MLNPTELGSYMRFKGSWQEKENQSNKKEHFHFAFGVSFVADLWDLAPCTSGGEYLHDR